MHNPVSDPMLNNISRLQMPAEWDSHRYTLLAWPDNRETWPGERLNRAEHVYADVLQALNPYEDLIILVANEQAHQAAAAMIQKRELNWSRIRLVRMPVNDVWIRDYGPIGLIAQSDDSTSSKKDDSLSLKKDEFPSTRRKVVLSNWQYNAWGGKYPPWDDDNRVPQKLARLLDYPVIAIDRVLEGGSIEVNGAGCGITTESVLLNPNRNPGFGKDQMESVLQDYLGIERLIWLKSGLRGDDTDGHVDDLSRFVSQDTILTSVTDDRSDPNYEVLKENREILSQATDLKNRPFRIIDLPLPATRIQGTTVDGSEFVPASYANFYIGNGCVLVPLYDQRYDAQVLKLFSPLFPRRKIIGIPCKDLVWGQGSIHCITQQIPLAVH